MLRRRGRAGGAMAFKSRKLKELDEQIAFGEKSNHKMLVEGLMRIERLTRELRGLIRRSGNVRTQIKRARRHLERDIHIAEMLSKTMHGLEKELVEAERGRDRERARELNKRVRRRDKDAELRLSYLARRTKAVKDMEKETAEILKVLRKLS